MHFRNEKSEVVDVEVKGTNDIITTAITTSTRPISNNIIFFLPSGVNISVYPSVNIYSKTMRTKTFDAYYLHTAVKYFKVPKDVSNAESKDFTFDDGGSLVFGGETYEAEREVMIERGNPYAVRWDMAWFEFDPKETDEDPPYSVPRSMEAFDEDLRAYHVVTHHHVAVTKQTEVTDRRKPRGPRRASSTTTRRWIPSSSHLRRTE